MGVPSVQWHIQCYHYVTQVRALNLSRERLPAVAYLSLEGGAHGRTSL
jgi:hypothetical protein